MACVGNLVCRGHVAGLELRIAQQCRITALSYRMLQHECRVNVAVSCTAVCVTLSPPSPTFCTLHAVRTIKSACFSTYLMRVASLLLFLLLLLLLFLFLFLLKLFPFLPPFICRNVRLLKAVRSRMQLNPSCDSPDTSRHLTLGGSDVCLVGETPTCSVPAF